METEFAAATRTEGICCVALLDDCRVQCAVCSVVALCVSSSSFFFFLPCPVASLVLRSESWKTKKETKAVRRRKKRESDALGK